MTPVTASLHLPPIAPPRFWRCLAAAPVSLQNHLLHRRSRQNRAADRSRGDKLATAIVGPPSTPPANAPPTQAAALSNPHRRQTPTQRPAASFLGGFRTPALTRADRSERAGIRNPSPEQPCRWRDLNAPKVEIATRTYARLVSAARRAFASNTSMSDTCLESTS